jgi:hypothetical protein
VRISPAATEANAAPDALVPRKCHGGCADRLSNSGDCDAKVSSIDYIDWRHRRVGREQSLAA